MEEIGVQIEGLEQYCFGDREAFRKSLVPGSFSHSFFTAMELINSPVPMTKEKENRIESLIGGSSHLPNRFKRALSLRQLLKSIDQKSQEAKREKERGRSAPRKEGGSELSKLVHQLNKATFNFEFKHTQPPNISSKIAQSTSKHSSRIEETKCKTTQKELIEGFLEKPSAKNIMSFSESLLEKMDPKVILEKTLDCFEVFLSSAMDFSIWKDFPVVLKSFLKKKREKKDKNYSIPKGVFDKMTLEQLDTFKEINDSDSEVKNDKNLIASLFEKTFQPSQTLENEKNLPKRRETLLTMLSWVETYENSFKSHNSAILPLKTQLIYSILASGKSLGIYDLDLFRKYIKRPLAVSNFQSKESMKAANKQTFESFWLNVHKAIGPSLEWMNQDKLIESYLKVLFETKESYLDLREHLDEKKIGRVFCKAKIYKGEEVQSLHEHIKEEELQAIIQKKKLKIANSSPRLFSKDEEVKLSLKIKNVSQVLVRVFEISTENYYKSNWSEVPEDINLDGLLAQEETMIRNDAPPAKVLLKEFKLETISSRKRGFFIVEFVGGGLTTRAVIKKGFLSFVTHTTIPGLVFEVLDEEGTVLANTEETPRLKRAGIYLEGIFYEANQHGKVLVPFPENSKELVKALLISDGFSELIQVSLPKRKLELKCSFVYDQETLVPENEAQFIIQPRLYLNDTLISLGFLKELSLLITSKNDLGVSKSQRMDNLQLAYDADLVVKQFIDPRMCTLAFKLSGKSPDSFQEKESKMAIEDQGDSSEVLLVERSLEIDLKQEDSSLYSMHLRRGSDGYRLFILGRNGEPLTNTSVSLLLKIREFNENQEAALMTDENGAVFLGEMRDVRELHASFGVAPEQKSKIWFLEDPSENKFSIKEKITITKGEKLVLEHLEGGLSPEHYKLVQVIMEPFSVIHNLFSKVCLDPLNEKKILIDDLEIGQYIFTYKGLNKSIRINVVEGVHWNNFKNFIISNGLIVQEKLTKSELAILSVDFNGKKVKLKVHSEHPESTKVHFFLKNFVERNSEEKLEAIRSQIQKRKKEKNQFSPKENVFLAKKVLSEEICYILERRTQKRIPGNTLEKPKMLLKRAFVKETKMEKEQLNPGTNFRGLHHQNPKSFLAKKIFRGVGYKAPRKQVMAFDSSKRNFTYESERNFLKSPGYLIPNIKLDQKGEAEITIGSLIDLFASLEIIVSSAHGAVGTTVPIPKPKMKNEIKKKDLRLKETRKAGCSYAYERKARCLVAGEEAPKGLSQSTEKAVIEKMSDVFELLKEYARYFSLEKSELDAIDQFGFVIIWDSLSLEEKQRKYAKFASHELNLFIFFKDRKFFDVFIRPFLQNKMEKDFIDLFLTGTLDDLEPYFHLSRLTRLNALELCLLISKLRETRRESCLEVVEWMRNTKQLNQVPLDIFKRRFDTVLNSKQEKTKKEPEPEDEKDNKRKEREMDNDSEESDEESESKMEESFGPESQQDERVQRRRESPGRGSRPRRMLQTFSYGGARHMNSPPNQESRMISRSPMETEPPFPAGSMRNQLSDCAFEENMNMRGFLNREIPKGVVRPFKQLGCPKEFVERRYFLQKLEASQGLVKANGFWVDLAEHLTKGSPVSDFLTPELIHTGSSLTEVLGVLTFIALPFRAFSQKESQIQAVIPDEPSLKPMEQKDNQNRIIFTKEFVECESEPRKLNISIIQRFFDNAERYSFLEGDPNTRIEQEISEFLVSKVYGCQIIITNSTNCSQEVQVTSEVPEGSIPIKNPDYTRSDTVVLGPYSTHSIEFFFYFPRIGRFTIYPSSIAKDGKVVCSAAPSVFEVVGKKKSFDLDKMEDVLSHGSKEDLINFMRSKNLLNENAFRIQETYWLLKSKETFKEIIGILRQKKIFDQVAWSYSFHHCDLEALSELLMASKASSIFEDVQFLESSLVRIDKFRVFEYHPMVNSRAHQLQNARNNLLNQDFNKTYKAFLVYIVEKGKMTANDQMTLAYYLLLQDRTKESLELFDKLDSRDFEGSSMLQFDYFDAYLDFYRSFPRMEKARGIIERYLAYPVVSWRNLFIEMANQLAEFDGEREIAQRNEKTKEEEPKANTKSAKEAQSAQTLFFEIKNDKVVVHYQNLDAIRVAFYKMDIEVLFSRNPFLLGDNAKDFGHVLPNASMVFTLKQEPCLNHLEVEIPKEFKGTNVYLQVSSESKSQSTVRFSATLQAQINEENGRVKVTDEQQRAIPACYVKVYAKKKDQSVVFYKDGYTDICGGFEYALVSEGEIEKTEAFSLLFISDEHGAVVKEAKPPSRFGKSEGSEMLLRFEGRWREKQRSGFQQQRNLLGLQNN